jgi:hypothetical protein
VLEENVSQKLLLLILHFFSCAFLTGLIWVIQILTYPGFSKVAPDQFLAFHAHHSSAITWIVGPVMLLEVGTAGLLLLQSSNSIFLWMNLIGLMLIWLSTLLLSIPYHNILSVGFDVQAAKKLVITNWPRTILWSLRSGLLAFYIQQCVSVWLGDLKK